MKWNRELTAFMAVLLLILSAPLFASTGFHAHQLEGIVGVNHSTHSLSTLHLGSGEFIENDTLKNESANNDVIWGVAYAYNVLPHPNVVLQHVLLKPLVSRSKWLKTYY